MSEPVEPAEPILIDAGISPQWPCKCGGSYALGYRDNAPVLTHTLPYCARYLAVSDTEEAVRFSAENRAAAGHFDA